MGKWHGQPAWQMGEGVVAWDVSETDTVDLSVVVMRLWIPHAQVGVFQIQRKATSSRAVVVSS
jgi:hypothetical protein